VLDFSQNGEQQIILDYFQGFVGTFLDCGANDGFSLSNSRALSLLGWKGVLVEPSDSAFAKLKHLYSGTDHVLIHAAVTDHDGMVDFWDCGVHLHKGDTSLLSTIIPETMDRWKRSSEQFTKTTVMGITFPRLLHLCRRHHFDFISVDAEGADWSILRQMDLAELGCRLLCVETNGVDEQKFIDYCARHGMKLHRKVDVNLFFART